MKRTVMTASPLAGTCTLNCPLSFVIAPPARPATVIAAPFSGSFVPASVTCPVTSLVCAASWLADNASPTATLAQGPSLMRLLSRDTLERRRMRLGPWASVAVGLALSASQLAAQTRDVTGQVTDAGTKEPLNGAAITVAGRAGGAMTNDKGQFRVQVPASGEAVITVRFIGYLRKEVRVPPGESNA